MNGGCQLPEPMKNKKIWGHYDPLRIFEELLVWLNLFRHAENAVDLRKDGAVGALGEKRKFECIPHGRLISLLNLGATTVVWND